MCESTYKGNSFPWLHGTKCILEGAHQRHNGGGERDLSWVDKTPEEIKEELKDDYYRAPECCRFPYIRVEYCHILALEEDKIRTASKTAATT